MAVEEQTIIVAQVGLDASDKTRSGQKLVISNRTIVEIAFPLRKYNNPTGDITFGVRKVSDGSLIGSQVWGDAVSLTDTPTWYELGLFTPLYVNEEVYLFVEFNGGDSGNIIGAGVSSTDVKANERRVWFISPTWTQTSDDAAYKYVYQVGQSKIYPSDPVARVSSIRHICRPGFFRMQVGVGDIGLDIDLAESSVRTALDTAFEPEYLAREKFLAAQKDAEGVIPAGLPFGERASVSRLEDNVFVSKYSMRAAQPGTERTTPPEVGQLTDYAKKILETPGAKALQTRIAGLKAGVEAVVTSHTVDVMREQGGQASLLMELQRIQKAASSTGITSVARQVLIKRAIQLKQQLDASYRSR